MNSYRLTQPTHVLLILCTTLIAASPLLAQKGTAPSTSRGSASWVVSKGDQTRFGARFAVADTEGVIYLDSLIANRPASQGEWVAVDSVRTYVALNETMLTACGLSADSLSDLYVAVVRDSADAQYNYPKPRLAWVVDTLRARIRPLDPSTVHCVQEYAGP